MLRSITAPSEPSSSAADAVLLTTIELNSSEAKTLKSNARSRLNDAPSTEVAIVSMPLTRTRVNCAPRPRTVIWRPSPASRSIATPGIRCSDSARLVSGNLAMSSATMTSTWPTASRLADIAAFSDWRKPETMMTLSSAETSPDASPATSLTSSSSSVPESCANAGAEKTSALPASKAAFALRAGTTNLIASSFKLAPVSF